MLTGILPVIFLSIIAAMKNELTIQQLSVYANCRCMFKPSGFTNRIKGVIKGFDYVHNKITVKSFSGVSFTVEPHSVKPVLISPDDTPDIWRETALKLHDSKEDNQMISDGFIFLISKGVDVFGWIEAGKAVRQRQIPKDVKD